MRNSAASSCDNKFNCKLAQYTSPAEARSSVLRMCNKVLLPDPDSPTMASISPRFTSNDSFSKSTRSDAPERKTFLRPSTRSIRSSVIGCTGWRFRSKGYGLEDPKLQLRQYQASWGG